MSAKFRCVSKRPIVPGIIDLPKFIWSLLVTQVIIYVRTSALSHGGHIVPGNQKSFVLPRQASQWKPWRGGVVKQSFFVSLDNMAAVW